MTLKKGSKIFLVLLLMICLLLLFGCQKKEALAEVDGTQNDIGKNNDIKDEVIVSDEEDDEDSEDNGNSEDSEESSDSIDLQKIKPNEAGQIMVLMYHSIGKEEKEFTRTPENFRKDLEKLYEQGYRPISLQDYVEGNIDIPAGFSPVVITFDDGNQNQFNVIGKENGSPVIDPDCAVGILVDFHVKHPDFPLEVTFFVNDGVPFGQKEYLDYKLNYIIDQGMDIGNHTATHYNFTDCKDSKSIENEIWTVKEKVEDIVPGYHVNTLSLPYGSKPEEESLFQFIVRGQEHDYHNIAIVEVGWDPYKSPYTTNFNSAAIHRVRASDLQEYVKGTGIYDWINRLENGERTKFVSDGNPDKVTVPKNYEDQIDEDKIVGRELITYTIENEQD